MAADFKGYFSRETESLLYLLGYQAEKESFKIYSAGNFVRDLFLGRKSRKLDLLLKGDLESYTCNLQRSLSGKMQYSKLMDFATVNVPGLFQIDLSTIKDEVYILSEEPASLQASLKNELYRRDFTIDTLAMELNPYNFCKLYDFFHGAQDLSEGTIRVLYSLSFVNEPLRLLRALRLEQRYGFSISEDTISLMHTAIAGKVLLQKVSREVIGREVRLIFTEPAPYLVLRRLQELGLWQQVFPRLPYKDSIPLRLQRLEQIRDSRKLSENKSYRYSNFIISICAMFYGLSTHDIHYLSHILRLRRKERQRVMELMETLKPVLESRSANMEENENRLVAMLEKQYAGKEGEEEQNAGLIISHSRPADRYHFS